VLDGKGNFRKKYATKKTYKGNRKQDRPPHFYEVKKLLIEKYNFVVVNGIEADDYLGIIDHKLSKPVVSIPIDGKLVTIDSVTPLSYIASIDKDLLTLNTYHYDLKKHTI
jgi:hypothetical protein